MHVSNLWKFQFEAPDPVALLKIVQFLRELPILDQTTAIKGRAVDKAIRGDVEAVVQKLAEALDNDFRTNTAEAAEVPYKFDYVVMDNTTVSGELAVMTRLFHPREPGNIYYGRFVRRMAVDQYLLWIQD